MSTPQTQSGVELDLATSGNSKPSTMVNEEKTQITNGRDFLSNRDVGNDYEVAQAASTSDSALNSPLRTDFNQIRSAAPRGRRVMLFAFGFMLAGVSGLYLTGQFEGLIPDISSLTESLQSALFLEEEGEPPMGSSEVVMEPQDAPNPSASHSFTKETETLSAPPPPLVLAPSKEKKSVAALYSNLLQDEELTQQKSLQQSMGSSPLWSAQEEEMWRTGISHMYPWQRYKTVLEVKKTRLSGSEVILWDALADTKLWVRVRAFLTLGDFGVPVTPRMAKETLGEFSVHQLDSFLKRFAKNPSAGELFALKQLLRGSEAWEIRLRILKILARANQPGDEIYVYAATKDSSRPVRIFARQALGNYPKTLITGAKRRFEESQLFPSDLIYEDKGMKELRPQGNKAAPTGELQNPFLIKDVSIYSEN